MDRIGVVLLHFPPDCRPQSSEPLGAAGGFSGAQFWRQDTPRGRLCLRCWPPEHPSVERLRFIHGVLGHVAQAGFTKLPLPIRATDGTSYVESSGRLWQLEPWIEGEADFRRRPTRGRLAAALEALAEFHAAAATFDTPDALAGRAEIEPLGNLDLAPPGPLPGGALLPPVGPAPAIVERRRQLARRLGGEAAVLRSAVAADRTDSGLGSLVPLARSVLEALPRIGPALHDELAAVESLRVPLIPAIRDIWHDHVLFAGDRVVGLVDFGALRVDTVAADVARLLGSLVGDDRVLRNEGLTAYTSVRPLSGSEQRLIDPLDQSGVLLGGLNWIDWLFVERRQFADMERVAQRLRQIVARLESMVPRPAILR